MDKFTTLTGVAAPLPMINVDTDKIIPKQYLKTIERKGLGVGLFDELRRRRDGSEIKEFVLNQPAYAQAKVLVAGENFGCGSSREHAPWALLDFGIRCVISESFADIFYNNCFKNGVLPITLPKETVAMLMEDAKNGANAVFTIDLEKQTISRPDGEKVHFDIDPFRKHCMLNGLDDIGLTLQKNSAIEDFESKLQPWALGQAR
ncbi:MAG TPA: 3-isopropylmalate dehydratase small subunit [Stellaceae bacterium]|jgi:3-isopropylmalate/(R)-2-methylmalate dehydratase small subunit|nr:3-isopropylmalate dehydratase small subunit [Stellaceae bacterium]